MRRGSPWPWIKKRRFSARFNEPVWSCHLPSWADFITVRPSVSFRYTQVHRKGRAAMRMIKLTETREIAPYVWVHPDEDDRVTVRAGITTISAAYVHRPVILPRLISQDRITPKLSKCARTCCIRMFEDRDRMDRARCERASCASSRTLGTTAGRSLLAIILIVRILTR